MQSLSRSQWLALVGAVFVFVLLLLLPRTRAEEQVETEQNPGMAVAGMDLSNIELQVELELDSLGDFDQKLKRAEAYVSGSVPGALPMKGVLMLRQLAQEYPEDYELKFRLAEFSAQTSQWDKVEEYALPVVEKGNDDLRFHALILLEQVYRRRGDLEKVVKTMKTYVPLVRDSLAKEEVKKKIENLELSYKTK